MYIYTFIVYAYTILILKSINLIIFIVCSTIFYYTECLDFKRDFYCFYIEVTEFCSERRKT